MFWATFFLPNMASISNSQCISEHTRALKIKIKKRCSLADRGRVGFQTCDSSQSSFRSAQHRTMQFIYRLVVDRNVSKRPPGGYRNGMKLRAAQQLQRLHSINRRGTNCLLIKRECRTCHSVSRFDIIRDTTRAGARKTVSSVRHQMTGEWKILVAIAACSFVHVAGLRTDLLQIS